MVQWMHTCRLVRAASMSVTEVSVVVMATGLELGAWDLARFTWNWRAERREGGEGTDGGMEGWRRRESENELRGTE